MRITVQLFSGLILVAFYSVFVKGQETPYVLPGNASWLGSDGSVDRTPSNYESFLPFPYVVLGNQAVAIARVIIESNQECPSMVMEKDPLDGIFESPKLTLVKAPEVTLRAVGDYTLPHAFPIKVCEARLETNEQKLAWSKGIIHFDGIETNIPVPSDPKRFALVADTGLRVKPTNLGLGTCNSTFQLYDINQCPVNFTESNLTETPTGDFQSLDDWRLSDLMKKIVEQEPDVVVYMGDYLYRQGPCPANNTENETCTGINEPEWFNVSDIPPGGRLVANFLSGHWGDNWFGWWADFFYPAQTLLHKAPFIALRGNHEICSRAGSGYFLFLSQESYNGTTAGTYCKDYTDPYNVPFENENFLVMDDSFISPLDKGIDSFIFEPDKCPPPPGQGESPIVPIVQNRHLDHTQTTAEIDKQVAKYTAYMEQIRLLSESYDTNFYTSHRPVFGVACNDTTMVTLDWTIQQSLRSNTLDRVVATIGGHMHWLEALVFKDLQLPTQLVVGHGGTKLIPNYVNQSTLSGLLLQVGREDQDIQGTVERGITDSRMFGFAMMDRMANGNYNVTFLSLNATTNRTVKVDFPLVIPKGPRVISEETPTSGGRNGSFYGVVNVILAVSVALMFL